MAKLIVLYDNWCPNCSKFVRIIKKLDWFNFISDKKLRDEIEALEYSNLDIELAKDKMASLVNSRWVYGYNSLFLIFLRLPLFWILIPLFWLLKITKLGSLIYNELAINRKIIPIHCGKDKCGITQDNI